MNTRRSIPPLLLAVLCWLLVSGSATVKAAPAAAHAALFFVPEPVETGKPVNLLLTADRAANRGEWIVEWGDGAQDRYHVGTAPSAHVYQAPGVYELSLRPESPEDASPAAACVDYARVILGEQPAAYFRFGVTRFAEPPSSPGVAGDGSLPNPPSAVPSGLPWEGAAASFDRNVSRLPTSLAAPTDAFAVEFWFRTPDFTARQELVSSATGARLSLADRAVHFELPRGVRYSQPLPADVTTAAWHHLCLCYERAPLFPYANTARFYLDGLLLGEQTCDRYDTGPVSLPDAVLGGAPGGGNRFKGNLAELAFYRRALPPHRILAHVLCFQRPHVWPIIAAAPGVEPFIVDAPHVSQTVAVALDPSPGADNGPALRAAVQAATPGTRLQIVDATTGKPGGSFHVNSLDGGHDWAAVRVLEKHDLELDGGGATLIFSTDCRQFYIKNCERVALRNFSIDLDQTRFRVGVYARILNLNPATGDVRFRFVNARDMSPDRGVPAGISMWRWRPHDPKTLRITKGPSFKTGEAFEGKPVRDSTDASILLGRVKPSLAAQLEAYRQGANLFMVNNARFENNTLCLENSAQMTFERINFYSTLGMVFLSTELNHVRVSNCRIGLPPGLTAADRPLAAGADGYHFHDTQGYVLFEHNEIALTDDDPITIKDGVWRDVKAIDADTLTLRRDARVGDEFVFYHWDFSPMNYQARVIENTGGQARMDQPLPPGAPESFLAMNTRHHTNQWVIRDCRLHDYYGRLLLCTAHGLIEGNTIRDSYLHIGASNASFDSAGIASSVVVRDNLLIGTNADTGIWGSESAYPVFRDITFASNSFVGKGLNSSNTGSLLVAGNYFEKRAGNDSKPWVLKCVHAFGPDVCGNVELSNAAHDFSLVTTQTDGLRANDNTVLVSAAMAAP